jgi:RNA-directed DNA polymerase
LRNGLQLLCNPYTAKDIERRRFGASIFRSPASRRCALWACRLLRTVHFNEASLRCCRLSTSKIFYHARSADALAEAPTKRWQRCTRGLQAERSEWVLEADLKNFFGSLSHEWMLRFVEHRVGDQRLISLIRRWLKAGVLEKGEVHLNEEGTPQGGSISVLLSNLYLHYVLDLWFERVVKPRLRGEACMVRYIDDFVLCFQYRADALRVQEALANRLRRFNLTLEPAKTKLVEFGRYAQRHAGKRGRKRPETIYFLGFTLYCTRNRKGNFRIGMRTEKSRLRRALTRLQEQMRLMRHSPLPEQVDHLNQMLRGHDAYYGIAGNIRSLLKVHRAVERYWRKILSSRSWHGAVPWEQFQRIKSQFPLLKPKLHFSYPELQALAKL